MRLLFFVLFLGRCFAMEPNNHSLYNKSTSSFNRILCSTHQMGNKTLKDNKAVKILVLHDDPIKRAYFLPFFMENIIEFSHDGDFDIYSGFLGNCPFELYWPNNTNFQWCDYLYDFDVIICFLYSNFGDIDFYKSKTFRNLKEIIASWENFKTHCFFIAVSQSLESRDKSVRMPSKYEIFPFFKDYMFPFFHIFHMEFNDEKETENIKKEILEVLKNQKISH